MVAHGIDDRLVDGRYARLAPLGRGGFGIVWRARDTLLQRDVAMKEVRFPPILTPEEQASLREKVLREARAAGRLSHPAVVTIYDVVEEDGRPFIVMELVDAPNLAEIVERDGPLSDRQAAEIGVEVIGALALAHAEGIIHRDVKPANVMVSPHGRVQLADFGIASIIDDPKVSSSGQLAGSPSYMAPEQARNLPPSPATDLWGLGATLYFAVEGDPPFEKDGAIATLTSVLTDDAREMQQAGALGPLLRDLLRKNPDERPSVDETRRRLDDVAAGIAATGERSPTVRFDADELAAAMAGPSAAVETLPAAAPPPPEPVAAAAAAKPIVVDPGPPTQPAAASVSRPEPAPPPPPVAVAEAEADPGPPTQPATPPGPPTRPAAPPVSPAKPVAAQGPAPRPVLAPPEAVRTTRAEPVPVERPERAAVRPAGGGSRSRPVVAAVAVLAALALVAVLLATRDSGDGDTASPDASATTVAPADDDSEASDEETSASTQANPAPNTTTARPANGGSRPDGVPRDWVSYQDPATGYALFHPPGWNVITNGSLTDFRDPDSAAYLRVDHTSSPGPSAVQAWLDFEPRFAAENPNYERIRIDPTTFQGYQAAIWEFTYTGLGTDLRAADLGFVTGSYGFALNFQTRVEDWDDMQDVFEAFQASFRAPPE